MFKLMVGFKPFVDQGITENRTVMGRPRPLGITTLVKRPTVKNDKECKLKNILMSI